MSTDPHGIIYYGIKLGDLLCDYHDINEQWEYEHRPTQPEGNDYPSPEWDAWRAKLREYEASPNHVQLDWFGAESCECYVVHAPALELRVEWSEQIDLGFRTFEQQPEADAMIKRFCEKFNIPYRQPTWHLAAYYF